jgi:hypothetical protein
MRGKGGRGKRDDLTLFVFSDETAALVASFFSLALPAFDGF